MPPCRLLFVLVGLFAVPGLTVLRIRDSRKGTFQTQTNHILINHMIGERGATDEISCTLECVAEPKCRSVNFKKGASSSGDGAKCQLNNATRFSARKEDYQPNQEYDHVFDLDDIPVSCSHIKIIVPSSTSGYYSVRDASAGRSMTRLVYCDMENHGGGWTLVASISNTNNNHLNKNKVNCLNKTLCVEYTTTNIQTRKLSDDDIHIMADMEGGFRVDVLKSPPYTTFFKIPSGSQYFDSSCVANNCARLITSHYYPYQWESNCKGTTLGYKFGLPLEEYCYHVFDSESFECPTDWFSSKYSTGRALYGFICHGNQGIYPNQNGFLFVR